MTDSVIVKEYDLARAPWFAQYGKCEAWGETKNEALLSLSVRLWNEASRIRTPANEARKLELVAKQIESQIKIRR